MISFLVFFIVIFQFVKSIEIFDVEPIYVPFSGTFGGHDLHFNLSVGSPEKKIKVFVDNLEVKSDLEIPSDSFNITTDYYPGNSSSFQKTNETIVSDGICGTETFQLGNSIINNKAFKAFHQKHKHLTKIGSMGIYRTRSCKSFVESVLEDQKEQVLTFAVNKIKPTQLKIWETPYNGQLIFGSKAPELCQSNWTFMNEVPDKRQWTFKVDKLSVGQSTFSSPGKAFIDYHEFQIELPKDLFEKVHNEFGDNWRNGIPCKHKKDMIFQLNGKEFRVPSAFFTLRDPRRRGKFCFTDIIPSDDDVIRLPFTTFSNHCVLYDYKEKRVGFTKRV